MKNENSKISAPGILVLVCAALLCSCHAKRAVVDNAERTETAHAAVEAVADTVQAEAVEAVVGTDTVRVESEERGAVEIRRDSAGRPVFIFWNRAAQLDYSAFATQDAKKWFAGLNSTRRSESGEESETKEQQTYAADPGERKLIKLAIAMMALMTALFVVFQVLWPWAKNKIKAKL